MGETLQRYCRNNCSSILVQTLFVLAFVGGYIAFFVTFYQTNRDKTVVAEFMPPNNATPEVTLWVTINAIDPAEYVLKVTVDLDIDTLPRSWLTPQGVLNYSLVVGVGRDIVQVPPTANFKPFTTKVPLSKGSFDYYPFDNYECPLDIYAYDGRDPWHSDVDIKVILYSAINYGFSFTVDMDSLDQDQGETIVLLQLDRTNVFRLYPVFLILAFWFIGISWCIFVSRAVIWNKAKVEPPIVGAAISLLFALPSFRNTAPQSPPIGCTLDVCSFYWAMLLAVLSVIGVILRYLQNVPAPPPRTNVQQIVLKHVRKLRGRIRQNSDNDIGLNQITKK